MASETSSRSVRLKCRHLKDEYFQQYWFLDTHTPVWLCVLLCLWFSAPVCVRQTAVGNNPVQDVCLSSNTKKLLIRLADSCDRLQHTHTHTLDNLGKKWLTLSLLIHQSSSQVDSTWFSQSVTDPCWIPSQGCHVCLSRSVLTSLKVDTVALQRSETSGRVKGLIITAKGQVFTEPKQEADDLFIDKWCKYPWQDLQTANQDMTSTPDTLLPGTASLKIQSLVTINTHTHLEKSHFMWQVMCV